MGLTIIGLNLAEIAIAILGAVMLCGGGVLLYRMRNQQQD